MLSFLSLARKTLRQSSSTEKSKIDCISAYWTDFMPNLHTRTNLRRYIPSRSKNNHGSYGQNQLLYLVRRTSMNGIVLIMVIIVIFVLLPQQYSAQAGLRGKTTMVFDYPPWANRRSLPRPQFCYTAYPYFICAHLQEGRTFYFSAFKKS